MTEPELHVLENPALAVGELLAQATGRIALTGGTSPGAAYNMQLRSNPTGRQIHLLSDERRSARRRAFELPAREANTVRSPDPQASIHQSTLDDPAKAAAAYGIEIFDARFDLSLLGLGGTGTLLALSRLAATRRT
jgi:6-phosphogluconolactonase/glucosamine-6-phosphate isomerase/deaminase